MDMWRKMIGGEWVCRTHMGVGNHVLMMIGVGQREKGAGSPESDSLNMLIMLGR